MDERCEADESRFFIPKTSERDEFILKLLNSVNLKIDECKFWYVLEWRENGATKCAKIGHGLNETSDLLYLIAKSKDNYFLFSSKNGAYEGNPIQLNAETHEVKATGFIY